MTDQRSHAFHALEVEEALARLEARPEGLSGDEPARRLQEHGPNRLPEAHRRGGLMRFLAQFHNVLIYVLLVAAVITGLMGHWIDTGVILAVVLINAVIGFVQEGRAEAAMSAIRSMLAPRAAVLRDGRRVTIDGADLVPGDVVLLEAGDKVPADLRLLEAKGLAAQEAMLTGESVPVEKGRDPVAEGAALGDRASMLWSGTLVTQGAGQGLVVATGEATEIGRIGRMLAEVEELTTPLVAQMNRFARWLSLFILVVAGSSSSSATWPATTRCRSCSWRWSRSPSRPSPRGCRRCSPSRLPSGCRRWRGATPSSGACRRSRRWARSRSSAPTRPGRSPATR
jgi:magnesium-transporting ATPase (P-type)